eukprot:1897744-Rhodomonas_salina.1
MQCIAQSCEHRTPQCQTEACAGSSGLPPMLPPHTLFSPRPSLLSRSRGARQLQDSTAPPRGTARVAVERAPQGRRKE